MISPPPPPRFLLGGLPRPIVRSTQAGLCAAQRQRCAAPPALARGAGRRARARSPRRRHSNAQSTQAETPENGLNVNTTVHTRTDEFTLDPGISMNLYSDTVLNLPPEAISLYGISIVVSTLEFSTISYLENPCRF